MQTIPIVSGAFNVGPAKNFIKRSFSIALIYDKRNKILKYFFKNYSRYVDKHHLL